MVNSRAVEKEQHTQANFTRKERDVTLGRVQLSARLQASSYEQLLANDAFLRESIRWVFD